MNAADMLWWEKLDEKEHRMLMALKEVLRLHKFVYGNSQAEEVARAVYDKYLENQGVRAS